MKKDYGEMRLVMELTNICNLHCSYCLRDEEALYNSKAIYLQLDFLKRIFNEASEIGIKSISFTGGEATLHPQFAEAIEAAANANLRVSFVTNGWHFTKLWGKLQNVRQFIDQISFSLDGVTIEEHDRWRGKGSFVRLIQAFALCRQAKIPFTLKTVLRRDTALRIETFSLFAARMEAKALSFSHIFATSPDSEDKNGLTLDERQFAEQEIALLSNIFKMPISLDVGYYNTDPKAPCSPLNGNSFNVDYQGRMTLCCNMSGFRGSRNNADVIANLYEEPLADAVDKFRRLAQQQLKHREKALAAFSPTGSIQDLQIASPCYFCFSTLEKRPSWNDARVIAILPVFNQQYFVKGKS